MYEAKLRSIHAELGDRPDALRETPPAYRVTPHHPMITEAVDQTLRSIREILHKRGRLSSRAQALDELCKLMFAHVRGVRTSRGGISKRALSGATQGGVGLAASLKAFVDEVVRESLPDSLAHEVDLKDFELKLKPQEDDLASELAECFETLQRQTSTFSFSGFDVLNEVFGKFLNDSFVDEKELGQYLTPPEVVRFMVDLALHHLSAEDLDLLGNPRRCAEFGLILDPSCGVASFLVEAVHGLQAKLEGRMQSPDVQTLWLQNMLGRVLVGIDKSERMVRLALTNVAMFGFPAARLHLANSLARNGADARLTESLAGKAKLILTNPPFGARFQGNDLVKYQIATHWARRSPDRVDSEVLFMERYLEWLAPGGQLVAIVPDSILTNKAVFEDLRRAIADKIDLVNVVSLPSVTFGAAGTTTKTSILHLRKKGRRNGKPVRTGFAICQDIGFTVSTKANQRVKVLDGQGDLPAILTEIVTPPSKPQFVKWLDDATTFERWDAQHHASLSVEIEKRLAKRSDSDLYVSDVAELIDDRADPRRWAAKEFNYIEISDIDLQTCAVYSNCVEVQDAPSRARKMVRGGDVLVSTVRPERGTVGIVGPHQDGSVCTTGLAVLRPTGIYPRTLAWLLKTDFVIAQLMRNNVGIAYPAIDEACLLNVLLPARREDLARLEKQAREMSEQEERLHARRKEFSAAIEATASAWRNGLPTADSRLHPGSRTTSHHPPRKAGSDSHAQETFQLSADRRV
jgi:type I restriction-modification system DNA methylase subunit